MNEPGKPDAPAFRLDKARKTMRSGGPLIVPGVDVVCCRIHGRDFRFATNRAKDPIQRKHRMGRFYEPAELKEIKALFPLGGVFVDIGANVGNHSLFVAGFLAPSRIIPFEPNPEAYQLLIANVMLNGFSGVFDLGHLGVGVAEAEGGGYDMQYQPRNLGGSRMVSSDTGALRVVHGDAALAEVAPDMIKVDVEGMEMQVLRGIEATVARARPILMVEVDDTHREDFLGWTEAQGYEVIQSVRRYRNNTNFITRPVTEEAPA